jgi:hypothetical protein
MISFKASKYEIMAINENPNIQFKLPPKKVIKQGNTIEIKTLNNNPTIQFKTPLKNQVKQSNKSLEIKAVNEQPIIQFTSQIKHGSIKFGSIKPESKIFEIKALNELPTISFKNPPKKKDICDNNNKITIEITCNRKNNDNENNNNNHHHENNNDDVKRRDLSKIEFFIKDEIIAKIIEPYHRCKYDKVRHYINSTAFKKYMCFFENTKYKSEPILYLIKELTFLIRDSIEDKDEIKELHELVDELNQKIINLEKQVDKKKTYNSNIKTDLDVKVTLKDKYFIYISKFGIPKNGKFDLKKLEQC